MDTKDNGIILFEPEQLIQTARSKQQTITVLYQGNKDGSMLPLMRETVHFGVIPGTNKPTLLKPGAELLCNTFGLKPVFKSVSAVERFDDDDPLFHYRYECTLVNIDTGKEVASGIGSCNSKESKYGYRWVSKHEIPPHLDISALLTRDDSVSEFEWAVDKAETSGKWGKPKEYWDMFKAAIKSGTASKGNRKIKSGEMRSTWEITAITYRVPNPDVYSIVNTIDKMAQKRALVAATLIGTAASEFFTQDIEDLPDFKPRQQAANDVIDADFTELLDDDESFGNGSPAVGGISPFQNSKGTKPKEQYSQPTNIVTTKIDKRGQPYMVVEQCTLWTRETFRDLGYADAIIQSMGTSGVTKLPDTITITYVQNGDFREPVRVRRDSDGTIVQVVKTKAKAS